jgi:hypothetical protein
VRAGSKAAEVLGRVVDIDVNANTGIVDAVPEAFEQEKKLLSEDE